MSSARASKAAADLATARCALDEVSDPVARSLLASGEMLAMGPQWLLDAGGYAMACRWTGHVFEVFDAAGDHQGTFASWGGAERELLTIGQAWRAERS